MAALRDRDSRPIFTASWFQIATYLLGVCPFSIAFLVFLNSTVSFVVTDLTHLQHGVGDAVGTLGFADELLALIACPFWGILSDRIGVRTVCVLGYILIAIALAVFVQCKNVYPQLILARLLFSLGGAAASTMVTAVLPTMSTTVPLTEVPASTDHGLGEQSVDNSVDSTDSTQANRSNRISCMSVSSELTITPALYQSSSFRAARVNNQDTVAPTPTNPAAASSKIAGYVGMFAGCGALLALVLLLPLPERFQRRGVSPDLSLQYSYYIVATVALVLSLWCFFGLRSLREVNFDPSNSDRPAATSNGTAPLGQLWNNLRLAVTVGFKRPDICLGYVGGFVARASSVGISLFVPLLVNSLFRSSGICDQDDSSGSPDLKKSCAQAYVLSAELTGVSQLFALLSAPAFGYVSAGLERRQAPLIFASLAGILGYMLIATRFSIDRDHQHGSAEAFVSMCLIGISQIGAIVCSLGILSGGVLSQQDTTTEIIRPTLHEQPNATDQENQTAPGEDEPLLATASTNQPRDLSRLKGSIAGVYSLCGGVGILILTKVGGLLFDRVSFGAPFYIMAIFNGILLISCLLLSSKSLLLSQTVRMT